MAEPVNKLLQYLQAGQQQPQYTPEQIAEFERLQAMNSGQAVPSMGPMDFIMPGAGIGAGIAAVGGWPALMRYGIREIPEYLKGIGVTGAGGAALGGVFNAMDDWKRQGRVDASMPPVPSYPPKGPSY